MKIYVLLLLTDEVIFWYLFLSSFVITFYTSSINVSWFPQSAVYSAHYLLWFLTVLAGVLPAQIGRASCRERVSSPV